MTKSEKHVRQKAIEARYIAEQAASGTNTWRRELHGGVIAEGTLINGIPCGVHRQWFPNGQLRIERPYNNAKLHGTCRQFAPDGKQFCEFMMEDGAGIFLEYWDSGILKLRWRQFYVGEKFCAMGELFDIYGKYPIRSYTWNGSPCRTKKRFLKKLAECQIELPSTEKIDDPIEWARFAKEARNFIPASKRKKPRGC